MEVLDDVELRMSTVQETESTVRACNSGAVLLLSVLVCRCRTIGMLYTATSRSSTGRQVTGAD